MRLLGALRRSRIDTVAHPADEPPQTAAVIFTGTPRRGATLENRRGAPEVPPGWTVLGNALIRNVNVEPELLVELGGDPMPRRPAR